jgi:PAS domain S-box-containing protein
MTDATVGQLARDPSPALPELPLTASLCRTLSDLAPGFLWLVDTQGRFVYVNKTWEQFTGSNLELLNASGWEQFNHPDEVDQIREQWGRALERSEQFEMELRYRRHDGEYRWMLARVVPLRDSIGQTQGWVGTSVDIDELRKSQDALRHSEQELGDFFENAAVAIHWVGEDGTILRANQAELDLFGYDRDEYVGRNIAEFHEEKSIVEDALRRLIAGEVLHDYPARIRCKDGSIKDVLIDSSAAFPNGKFVHTR